jgi:hypothetical protein
VRWSARDLVVVAAEHPSLPADGSACGEPQGWPRHVRDALSDRGGSQR